ncbi:MAG: hypothetical protein ACRD8O_18480 [Bryobacteraceae bacterium]
MFAVAVPADTLNGVPVWIVMMPLACQLASAPFTIGLETAKNGMS